MSECTTGCGRPTERMLCNGCLRRLRGELADVGWLDTELAATLARQVVMAMPGSTTSEIPLAVGRGALKARSILRNRLVGWCLDLAETHGYDLPGDTLPMMAAWLVAYEDDVAIHPAADELVDEIHQAIVYAKQIVDLPANRTAFVVGPCPELTCSGQVRVFVPAEHTDALARMECRACERTWDTTQWSRLGKRIMARQGRESALLDSATAATLLGVTDRTVRNWISAGRLKNRGDERRILVDLADVEGVVDAA